MTQTETYKALWSDCLDRLRLTITEEEFENILDDIEDEGIIDENQTDLLQSALEFTDMTAEEISAKLVEWYTTSSFDGLTGTGITWDETGAVSKAPMAVVIENGVYVGVK